MARVLLMVKGTFHARKAAIEATICRLLDAARMHARTHALKENQILHELPSEIAPSVRRSYMNHEETWIMSIDELAALFVNGPRAILYFQDLTDIM